MAQYDVLNVNRFVRRSCGSGPERVRKANRCAGRAVSNQPDEGLERTRTSGAARLLSSRLDPQGTIGLAPSIRVRRLADAPFPEGPVCFGPVFPPARIWNVCASRTGASSAAPRWPEITIEGSDSAIATNRAH
jgi:hypothetical protein